MRQHRERPLGLGGCLGFALLSVAIISTGGHLPGAEAAAVCSTQIHAERTIDPRAQNSARQRPRLRPSKSCKRENDALVLASSSRNRKAGEEMALSVRVHRLGVLHHRGGGRGGKRVAAGSGVADRLGQLTIVQKAVASNLVAWAAIVGAMLAWIAPRYEEGIVRKGLVGAAVASTSVQVASNVLQARLRHGGRGEGGANLAALAGLKNFRWSYAGVLAVCSLGEFVQAAYVYHIYSKNNGLNAAEIAKMFLASTLSSMFTGLFAGTFLDRYGRRNGCMMWAVANVLQCLLIRSKRMSALLLGRMIAGAGATLLATGFESWMITEHHSRGYPSHLLADTFRMVTWGMGITSIASGFMGDLAVSRSGSMAPFNVAIVVSVIAGVLIGRLWTENYGDRSFSALHHTREAMGSLVGDGRLLMMGLVQVLFEAAMVTWIIFWVPALQDAASGSQVIALGTVFSTLMMSMCGGSSLFKLLTEGLPERLALSPEACLVFATGVSTVAMAASATGLSAGKLLFMFLVYEACIGLYLPAMATCRSKYIDDRFRGTVMNIVRVPMNLVAALMISGPVGKTFGSMDDKVLVVFSLLAGLTGVATLIQVLLLQREGERAVNSQGGVGRKGGVDFSGPRAAANGGAERKKREGTGSSS